MLRRQCIRPASDFLYTGRPARGRARLGPRPPPTLDAICSAYSGAKNDSVILYPGPCAPLPLSPSALNLASPLDSAASTRAIAAGLGVTADSRLPPSVRVATISALASSAVT